MSEYTDVKHMQKTGAWPNGKIPDWAIRKAEQLDCDPCHNAVIQFTYEQEIKRLQFICDELLQACEATVAVAREMSRVRAAIAKAKANAS